MEHDPIHHMEQQVGSLVGSQEIEARKLYGDARYDKIIELSDRRDEAITAFTRSRTAVREAFADSIKVLTALAIILALGWSIWFMV